MTVFMQFARATKNTFRFEEEGEPDQHKIGVLYVQKSAFGGVQPQQVQVTVEVEA